MKQERWFSLFTSSRTIIGLSIFGKKVVILAEQADDCLKQLWKISWVYRRLAVVRTWFESFRRRRNAAFWEGANRRWGKAIEAGIILTIALMPVLNSWEVLLGLTLLLYVIRFPERKLPDTGLIFFWLALTVSAIMAVGIKGLNGLVTVTVWLLIAGLAGRAFTAEFSRKVIRFILSAGLIWMVIGLWQQAAGVFTPAGWLEQGQNLLISVRSYSVFGNPNIYGMYLVSILIFAFLEINAGDRFHCAVARLIIPVALTSLFFTYSRTAWLLGLTVIIGWFGKRLCSGKHCYLLGLGILFLIVGIPGFKARIIGPVNFFESTLRLRVEIWRNILTILADFWPWGAGSGSFSEVYGSYLTGSGLVQHGHQLYLQLWLESGILSLAALIRVIAKSLAGFNGFHCDAKAVALVIAVFLISGLVETWWVHQFSGGYFWLLIGLLQSMRAGRINS